MIEFTSSARIFAAGLLVLMAACSNTLPLSYSPTTSVTQSSVADVRSVSVTDQRDESDKSWYGAVRGGYGNPLKVLHTNGPVSDDVATAFRNALVRRGLLAPGDGGQYDIKVDITQFAASQYIRREANVGLKLTIVTRDGRVVYTDTAQVDKVSGSVIALDVGAFGSPDELRALMSLAMNSTIDELLDKPALMSVLRAQPATSPRAAS